MSCKHKVKDIFKIYFYLYIDTNKLLPTTQFRCLILRKDLGVWDRSIKGNIRMLKEVTEERSKLRNEVLRYKCTLNLKKTLLH